MLDVARDNRVVSMAAKVGLKNNLVTMLDQLQRCQKSLNEFLEVQSLVFSHKNLFHARTVHKKIHLTAKIQLVFSALRKFRVLENLCFS